MFVIADTSPLNYLIQLDLIDVLPELYSYIYLPEEVSSELRAAQGSVLAWGSRLPSWIEIRSLDLQADYLLQILLLELDPGEAAAIALAE